MVVPCFCPASVARGVGQFGRTVRRAPARVALLALAPTAGALALAGGALAGGATPALAGGAMALAAGPVPSCSAGRCTVSFTTVGTGQSFTVPAGVSSLSVTLYGGAGGSTSDGGPDVAGGDGALVTAALRVRPGEALGVDVGGAGASSAGTAGAAVAGGANGGGNGFDSGGGGGATDITAGGAALLVAGGGGGAGTTQPATQDVCLGGPASAAGGAGGDAGSPGTAGQSVSGDLQTMVGGGGGAPGTTAGPGVGGSGGNADTPGGFGICPGDSIGYGFLGSSGSGTAGGSGVMDNNSLATNGLIGDAGGGGGGGGYFGGGAGGSGASELSESANAGQVISTSTTAGSGGGGGGASYTAGIGVRRALVSDAGNSGQVNGGNGEAVLTYADPTAADLAVSLSCPSSLGAGQSGACTLTVVNSGPAAASGTAAVLALPANVTEVSCTGGCTSTHSLLTWTSSSLAPGANVSYQAIVKAARPGTARLFCAAASLTPDPDPLNNTATATVAVRQ